LDQQLNVEPGASAATVFADIDTPAKPVSFDDSAAAATASQGEGDMTDSAFMGSSAVPTPSQVAEAVEGEDTACLTQLAA